MAGTNARHVLSHRADEVIILLIIIEIIALEWIGAVTGTVFNMKAVVFDVGVHACFFHEAVVLFGTVS